MGTQHLTERYGVNHQIVLAKRATDHENFWEGNKLTVSTDLRRKLALFPIHDPTVAHLCGASRAAQNNLYYYLETHLNKGRRRTSRLTSWMLRSSRRMMLPRIPSGVGPRTRCAATRGLSAQTSLNHDNLRHLQSLPHHKADWSRSRGFPYRTK
jgi:hypothetical protein